jgi:hypothetical protein
MSSDKQIMDCPICMEDIECTKNCITTECGHCFHASCLMKSVAHNGFGCPYCRSAMADDIKAEDDEWESVESFEDDEYALRGLRFFMNNIEGDEHDQYDMEDEDIDDEEDRESSVEVEEEEPKPSAAYLTEKLLEQGITMEQMVKAMLLRHDEYEAEEEAYDRVDGQIFGKIRSIIHNYSRPRQTIRIPPLDINVVTEFPPPVQQQPSLVEMVDDSAQPKVPRPPRPYRSTKVYIDETIAN